jgi:hypothetical protein
MKILSALIFLLSTIGISAQDSAEVKTHTSVVQQGEHFTFGEKSLLFKEVISDSRCPENVTCIWAGEAKILLEVFENGVRLGEKILIVQPTTVETIPLEFFKRKDGYLLTAFNLQPLPQQCATKSPKNYSLELRVEEKL